MHLLLLVGGAIVGASIAITLQLMWSLPPCNDVLRQGEGPACVASPGIEFLPTLFGALFGAIAADLIYTRRHR